MKLDKLSYFADAEPRSAAENMALDEAIFFRAAFPVMRSFRWIRPAVSFGYFTPWRSVVERFRERLWPRHQRRKTGWRVSCRPADQSWRRNFVPPKPAASYDREPGKGSY